MDIILGDNIKLAKILVLYVRKQHQPVFSKIHLKAEKKTFHQTFKENIALVYLRSLKYCSVPLRGKIYTTSSIP
jgi:hypothetical protein